MREREIEREKRERETIILHDAAGDAKRNLIDQSKGQDNNNDNDDESTQVKYCFLPRYG